jgi:hypothetical protein
VPYKKDIKEKFTMKCIKNIKTGKIERRKDEFAHEMVKTGKFVYCSKMEWKNYTKHPEDEDENK